MNWYHGGVLGLQVGDLILPPDETGVESISGMVGISHTDRVYMTHNLDDAIVYAGLQSERGGAVYRVEPLGLREREHEYSEHAPRARIVEVTIVHVGVGHARKVMARIQPEIAAMVAEDQLQRTKQEA